MAMRYLADVVTLELDAEKCTGCGMCLQVCPHGVFVVEDGKAAIVDRDACIECAQLPCRRPVRGSRRRLRERGHQGNAARHRADVRLRLLGRPLVLRVMAASGISRSPLRRQ